MKSYLSLSLLAAAGMLTSPSLIPSARAEDRAADERAICALEVEFGTDSVAGNADALAKLMAPTFVLTNTRAELSTKDEEVAEVRDGTVHYDVFDTTDMKVRFYGDAAVVTGIVYIKGNVKATGRVIDAKMRFTDTLVGQDGKWQVVAGQVTLLPKAPDAAKS